MKRRKTTFLIIIMALVAIASWAYFGIPWFLKERERAQAKFCRSNLRRIDAAKQQAAVVLKPSDLNQLPNEDQITWYLLKHKMVKCPSGGTYAINAWNNKPTCSLDDSNAPPEYLYSHGWPH